jgi:phosphocarrier protein
VSGPNSYEAEFTVRSELGLHARPAGQFVVLAGRFASEISVGRGADWVDGRSVLSLLSLAASRGTRLRIRAVGPDAQAAVEALGRVLEEQQAAPPRPPAG